MLHSLTFELQFVLCSLALWRVTHLFVLEDGPWDFVYHLRKSLGNSIFGKAMDCFYCLSIWLAIPLSLLLFHNFISYFVGWLALSGAACLLEQFTTNTKNINNLIK